MKDNRRYRRPLFEFERRGPYSFGLPVFGVYVNLVALAVFVGLFALWASLATAISLTVAVLVHEAGHAFAFRRRSIQVELEIRPPLGMAIVPMSGLSSETDQIDVSLFGPLFGLGTALVGYLLWRLTGSPHAADFAMMACWLNLFNLVPVGLLDGGQVIKTMTSSTGRHKLGFALQTLGMAALVLLAGYYLVAFGFSSSIFLIVITFVIASSYYREYQEFRMRRPEPRFHFGLVGAMTRRRRPKNGLSTSVIWTRSLAYLGMIAAFVVIYKLV
jgi:Zn-dependent protease